MWTAIKRGPAVVKTGIERILIFCRKSRPSQEHLPCEDLLPSLQGAIRSPGREAMVGAFSGMSRPQLAFGDCSCSGGTPGFANFLSKENIFSGVNRDSATVVHLKRHTPPACSTRQRQTTDLAPFPWIGWTIGRLHRRGILFPGVSPIAITQCFTVGNHGRGHAMEKQTRNDH